VLGSLLTRQYRFATRGIELTLQTAQQAIDIAGLIAGEVADRLGLRHGRDEPDLFSGEVVPEPDPRADAAPARAPEPPTPPPPTASAPAPTTAPAPSIAPAPAPTPEPLHVSAEPELVEEVAEPGAEDGAGAQIRVREPWPGYRSLKARDVVARLASATSEELAAIELYELAHANRKSVVVAAQRALKQASPPR
jgi:hypothetical protein